MWFNDEFLPSIFQRAGTGKPLWLSRKQTSVCIKYMQKCPVSYSDGIYTKIHYNYKWIWNGRSVILSYSKLNGCGSIEFGLNPEEQKAALLDEQRERELKEQETIERTKRHPKHLAWIIAQLKEKESRLASELSDPENPKEDLEHFSKELAECRRLLNLYQS